MSSGFRDDVLELAAFAPAVRPFLTELVGVRVAVRATRMGATHVLLAVERRAQETACAALAERMRPGQSGAAMLAALRRTYLATAGGPLAPTSLGIDCFTSTGADLLAAVARAMPAACEPSADEAARTLVRLACEHLSAEERRLLQYFLRDDGVVAGREPDSAPPRIGSELADRPFREDGVPDDRALNEPVRMLLQQALQHAGRTGHAVCQPLHLALACLSCNDEIVQRALHVYGQGMRLAAARDSLLARALRGASCPAPELVRESFTPATRVMFAVAWSGGGPATVVDLFRALLQRMDLDPVLTDELRRGLLRLDVAGALAFLQRSADLPGTEGTHGAGDRGLPQVLARAEDLVAASARDPEGRWIARPEVMELARALCSQTLRCTVLHGEPGAGCSALVAVLVRGVVAGTLPVTRGTLFLRIDAAALSEAALRSLLAGLKATPCPDIVLVLENLQRLVEHARETVVGLFEVQHGPRILGVLHTSDYRRLIANDAALAALVWSVELPEADLDTTVRILEAVAVEQGRLGVSVPSELLTLLARWADSYLGGSLRPGRAVQLLRLACDEAVFAARTGTIAAPVVSREHVAAVLARRSGIQLPVIQGERTEQYYRDELLRRVFGQPEAIARVARGLALARSTAPQRARPAAVFLFVGQTGTGKTLLAKEMAALYSPGGRFRQFAMGEFKELHSVSRLVGAPPGYVGYQEGGGLVEALLADPNTVLLFDEAEKAHPQVWETLLQLLSEGWVEDARHRVARADHAIIVLTSNMGQAVIDRGVAAGLAHRTIAQKVEEALRATLDPHTRLPYFRPELFGRIDDVIVFGPLGPEALEQIALREIDLAAQAMRAQKGVVLEPADGSWRQLAAFLTSLSRDDRKHGRAIAQALRNHVLAPLAGLRLSEGSETRVRVALQQSSTDGPRVQLQVRDGGPPAAAAESR